MKTRLLFASALLLVLPATGFAGVDNTVATAVFSKTGNGYRREYQADGTPKPEYYAIANGGAAGGTVRDVTVERLTFPDITQLVMPLLHRQGYRYAMDSKQASLLLVIHWGNTVPYNDTNFQLSLGPAGRAISELQTLQRAGVTGSGLDSSLDSLADTLTWLNMEDQIRNLRDAPNARLLGYIDDINDNNDMRRYVGGQRYNELKADVEDPRYYVIVSAYDFRELTQHNRQKLLWVTRVSVTARGNSFDESVAAMMKSSAKYFGQATGKMIRGEELRGRVEMRDLKFIGTESNPAPPASQPKQ